MNVSSINFAPTIKSSNTPQSTINKQIEQPQVQKLREFPSYYCSNINFNGKYYSIDFEFDFCKASKNIIDNHLDKMELTKGLNKKEQKDFQKNLFTNDKMTLMHFMYDKKPSILLNGEFPYFKNNEKYSFVRRTLDIPLPDNKSYLSNNTFAINNELVKQKIEENKELYTKRMGLDENSSTEEVFEELIGENSPLKYKDGYDDIIGITLGFSPINSILFQVERDIPNVIELRRRPTIYKEKMDNSFNSETSPYKDFSKEFKSDVQSSIDNLDKYFRKPDLTPIGYGYIHIAPDEKHTQKIIKDAEEILEQATN